MCSVVLHPRACLVARKTVVLRFRKQNSWFQSSVLSEGKISQELAQMGRNFVSGSPPPPHPCEVKPGNKSLETSAARHATSQYVCLRCVQSDVSFDGARDSIASFSLRRTEWTSRTWTTRSWGRCCATCTRARRRTSTRWPTRCSPPQTR